jgi:hypothetical protein
MLTQQGQHPPTDKPTPKGLIMSAFIISDLQTFTIAEFIAQRRFSRLERLD